MKLNVNRNRIIIAVTALALMTFAVVAYAADDDTVDLPTINDGRVNLYDIAAPVAIYDYYVYPYADDVDMGVLDSIEFWGITWEDHIDKVLEVTKADIVSTQIVGSTPALIASSLGYSLYKETDGSLTLVAPADSAGNVYLFNWTPSL